MLREQSAEELGKMGMQRSEADKDRENEKLLALREKETHEKMEKMRKYGSARWVSAKFYGLNILAFWY